MVGISERNDVPLPQAMDAVEGIVDRSSLANSMIGDDVPGLQTSQVGKSVIGSDKIDLPMTQMVDAGNALIQTFCNWKYRKE